MAFNHDTVINAGQEIRNGLSTLAFAIDDLETLISREHEIIRHSDLQQFEIVTGEKEALYEVISKASIGLHADAERIKECYAGVFEDSKNVLPSVTQVVEWLRKLAEIGDQTTQTKQKIVNHLANEIERVFSALQTKKREIQPKIEMNKYLISKLLNHHRASIRFWQEINEEASATYGNSGMAKSKSSSSILRVKA
jgi:hypothetical protein